MADARLAITAQPRGDLGGRSSKRVRRWFVSRGDKLREDDVDANRDLQRRWLPARRRERLAERTDPRLDLGHVPEPGGVPHVGMLRHQPEEVAWGGWVTLPELRAALADPRRPFTPDGRIGIERWLDTRQPEE